MYKFQNLNHALIGMSKILLENNVQRETRGFTCYELPNPVMICIEDPSDRYITIKERKWNKFLPFIESLWLALGVNDLDTLPGKYVKNLYNFSDDGHTWRAGYGPRIRGFSGVYGNQNIKTPYTRKVFSGETIVVDQLKFVIDSLKRDINTRQALITIADPGKDTFDQHGELIITKDMPCTRSLHFQLNTEGELDTIVHIRSNDLWWGFSSVNVFNFCFMQEYIANIVGVPVGKYYHLADNFHFYKDFKSEVERVSQLPFPVKQRKFRYFDKISSLEEFDNYLNILFEYEQEISQSKNMFRLNVCGLPDMFIDWADVIYYYWSKEKTDFINPYLNILFNGEKY